MVRKFNPEGKPAPPFYSHGVEIPAGARMVFVAGQVGKLPDGTNAQGVTAQTQAAAENLKGVLAAAGMELSDVVKYTIYLTDESLMPGFQAAGASLLTFPPPAITLLYVKALAEPDLLVEIEAVAAK